MNDIALFFLAGAFYVAMTVSIVLQWDSRYTHALGVGLGLTLLLLACSQ